MQSNSQQLAARATGGGKKRTRGQALVETGIALILLFGLTFGVLDAAFLFYTYLTLENAVTEATRFATTMAQLDDPDNPGNDLSREDSVRTVMRELAPGITLPDSEFDFFNVSDNTANSGSFGDVIRVTVTHEHPLMFPVLGPVLGGGSFTLRVVSTMRDEPAP